MTDQGVTAKPAPWARYPVPVWLTAAGLAVAIVGLFLPWVSATGGEGLLSGFDQVMEDEFGGTDPNGLTFPDGKTAIGLIVGLLIVLVVHFLRDARGKALPITGIVLSAILAFVGIGNISDIGEVSDTFFEPLGAELTAGVGLYLTALGGALCVVGMSILTAKSPRRSAIPVGAPAPPPPPAAGYGDAAPPPPPPPPPAPPV